MSDAGSAAVLDDELDTRLLQCLAYDLQRSGSWFVDTGLKLTNRDYSDARLARQILLTPVEKGTSRPALTCCDHGIREKSNSVEKRLIRPNCRLRSQMSFLDRKVIEWPIGVCILEDVRS